MKKARIPRVEGSRGALSTRRCRLIGRIAGSVIGLGYPIIRWAIQKSVLPQVHIASPKGVGIGDSTLEQLDTVTSNEHHIRIAKRVRPLCARPSAQQILNLVDRNRGILISIGGIPDRKDRLTSRLMHGTHHFDRTLGVNPVDPIAKRVKQFCDTARRCVISKPQHEQSTLNGRHVHMLHLLSFISRQHAQLPARCRDSDSKEPKSLHHATSGDSY